MKKTMKKITALLLVSLITTFGMTVISSAEEYNAQEKIKIACVGDSITYGAELSDRETEAYPALLQKYFEDEATVRNFGVSATSALKTAKYPYTNTEEYKKSLEFAPDILFIMLGTNDIKTENWTSGSTNFEKDYTDILNSYKDANSNVKIYIGIPPRIFKDNVYGERSTTVLEQQAFPKIYNVAKNAGAETVDIFNATLNYEADFPDFLHPNAEGHKIIAETIESKISSAVKNYTKNPITGASEWAEKELTLAYEAGIMPDSITSDFQNNITRAEFCESVVKIIPKETAGFRTASFKDTDKDYIERAYSVGIVNGVSDDKFEPDELITREEICAMLYRAYKIIDPNAVFTGNIAAADRDEISDWALESVEFMNNANIVLGDENGKINPKDYTSREQGIILVYRTFISTGERTETKSE